MTETQSKPVITPDSDAVIAEIEIAPPPARVCQAAAFDFAVDSDFLTPQGAVQMSREFKGSLHEPLCPWWVERDVTTTGDAMSDKKYYVNHSGR